MKYGNLKIGRKYVVKTNSNKRLNEYGLTEGTEVLLENIFNSWIYIFIVRGVKIGIRKSELNHVTWSHPK